MRNIEANTGNRSPSPASTVAHNQGPTSRIFSATGAATTKILNHSNAIHTFSDVAVDICPAKEVYEHPEAVIHSPLATYVNPFTAGTINQISAKGIHTRPAVAIDRFLADAVNLSPSNDVHSCHAATRGNNNLGISTVVFQCPAVINETHNSISGASNPATTLAAFISSNSVVRHPVQPGAGQVEPASNEQRPDPAVFRSPVYPSTATMALPTDNQNTVKPQNNNGTQRNPPHAAFVREIIPESKQQTFHQCTHNTPTESAVAVLVKAKTTGTRKIDDIYITRTNSGHH